MFQKIPKVLKKHLGKFISIQEFQAFSGKLFVSVKTFSLKNPLNSYFAQRPNSEISLCRIVRFFLNISSRL